MATTSGEHDEHDGGEPADDAPIPTKWSIDRIDDREKRFSFGASGLALAVSIFVLFGHFKSAKGQLSPQTVFVIGLVGTALLVGATVLGRRAPLGFVSLFLGASFAQVAFVLALPFFVLAVWLLYRSYKVQKEITARMRAAKGAATRPAGRTTTRSDPSPRTRAPAPGKAAPARKTAKGQAGPTPNKRYTPKQPSPPAPPPPKLSRRQRKAAADKD